MSTPTMVYKTGSAIRHDGNYFDYKIVEADAEEGAKSELEQALEEGWFRTTAEARECVPPDNEGPTREELKEMAQQLGLKYPSNTSTEKLNKLVNEALGS